MAKPILLSVDDDSDVLRAIERDLRSQYGAGYRVIGSDSPEGALDLLKQLKLRNDSVALLLADQRMPRMDGVEFLQQAMGVFPGAKRALLTAYADTNAAISAINQAGINYFFLKPWDPPAEHLYPQLDDLLDDWQATFRPTFQGIRVLGTRWSPRSYELRDFLARNHVPYQWIDVELSANDPETKRLLEALGPEAANLPVVLFPDGTKLLESVPADVAQKVGLRTHAQTSFYDLAIVGGGPAGLAAAVYGASEGLKVLVLESNAPGGQAGSSSKIENYLGFPTGISGQALAGRAFTQAQKFGAQIAVAKSAARLHCDRNPYTVELTDGSIAQGRTVVIASGAQYRKIALSELPRFEGVGVYYGATNVEAQLCSGDEVIVVGGGNSAGQAAVFLSQTVKHVHVLVRGKGLTDTMSRYLIHRIEVSSNITLRPFTEIAALEGGSWLERVRIVDARRNETLTLPIRHVFLMTGASPNTKWLEGCVALDEKGFVKTGQDLTADDLAKWPLQRHPYLMETNRPGVFAVGDARSNSVKRVASAVGEGSISVQLVHRVLAE